MPDKRVSKDGKVFVVRRKEKLPTKIGDQVDWKAFQVRWESNLKEFFKARELAGKPVTLR
jgi:hypothetical protein